jgi:hypothetical protein
MADVEAAKDCVEWVVSRIRQGIFGPPAERVEYDDFRVLAPRGDLAEVFAEESVLVFREGSA